MPLIIPLQKALPINTKYKLSFKEDEYFANAKTIKKEKTHEPLTFQTKRKFILYFKLYIYILTKSTKLCII